MRHQSLYRTFFLHRRQTVTSSWEKEAIFLLSAYAYKLPFRWQQAQLCHFEFSWQKYIACEDIKACVWQVFLPTGTLTLRITLLFVLQLFFDFHLLGCLLCVQRKCLESFWVGSWTKPCLTCLWSLARPWRSLSKSKSSWTSLVRRTCCRTSMTVCGHNICFPLHRTSRGYCWLLNSSSCLCCVN